MQRLNVTHHTPCNTQPPPRKLRHATCNQATHNMPRAACGTVATRTHTASAQAAAPRARLGRAPRPGWSKQRTVRRMAVRYDKHAAYRAFTLSVGHTVKSACGRAGMAAASRVLRTHAPKALGALGALGAFDRLQAGGALGRFSGIEGTKYSRRPGAIRVRERMRWDFACAIALGTRARAPAPRLAPGGR